MKNCHHKSEDGNFNSSQLRNSTNFINTEYIQRHQITVLLGSNLKAAKKRTS